MAQLRLSEKQLQEQRFVQSEEHQQVTQVMQAEAVVYERKEILKMKAQLRKLEEQLQCQRVTWRKEEQQVAELQIQAEQHQMIQGKATTEQLQEVESRLKILETRLEDKGEAER